MTLRILIVSTYFPPLNSIASLRPYSWAKYWSLAGHDVTVLTTKKDEGIAIDLSVPMNGFAVKEVPLPRFFYLFKRKYTLSRSRGPDYLTRSGRPGGLKHFLYSAFNILRHKKGIFNSCRMPDFTDFWIRPALKEIQNDPPWDLVISTAGPYATHIIAASIKKRKQAKAWIADYRDKWSDSIIYPGIFPFNVLEKSVEKRLIRNADLLTTISQPFADSYTLKYPNTKIISIENGFDPCDLHNINPHPIFLRDGKFRIVYTGTVYPDKQDPRPLFQAIVSMSLDPKHKNLLEALEVLFVGHNQGNLQKLINEFGIGCWVKLQNGVSRDDALRMQRDAHALLFLAWNDSSVDGVMTGKIFEYLFSKTPILAIGTQGLEASQQLILEAKAGEVFSHSEELVSYLIKHLRCPVKQKIHVDPNILNRYNRQVLAMKLLESINFCEPP